MDYLDFLDFFFPAPAFYAGSWARGSPDFWGAVTRKSNGKVQIVQLVFPCFRLDYLEQLEYLELMRVCFLNARLPFLPGIFLHMPATFAAQL